MTDFAAIPQEAAEALKKANTGMVNDALALAGINGGIKGVRPARGIRRWQDRGEGRHGPLRCAASRQPQD